MTGIEKDVDVLPLVCAWLSDKKNGSWLLIVDNADETKYFFSDSSDRVQPEFKEEGRAIDEFIPRTGKGTVLFTCRNRDLALRLVEYHWRVIDVKVMSSTEGLALLKKQPENRLHGEYEHFAELCEALERFPLAISQAVAFINKMVLPRPIARYLELLQQSAECTNYQAVLYGDFGDPRRHTSAKNSIVRTWQISFDHIREASPTAAELLSLMSFFNRQGIPAFVLQNAHIYDDIDGDHAFELDIATLQAYCLVSVDQDRMTFQMHRLVQFATKGWLKLQPGNRLVRLRRAFMELLDFHFVENAGTRDHYERNDLLLTHAFEVERTLPTDPTDCTLWFKLMHCVGNHLRCHGQYSIAERILHAATDVAKAQNGDANLDYLKVLATWSDVLSNMGDLDRAETNLQHIINICGKVLPLTQDTHELLFFSTLDLAANFRRKGRLNQAELVRLESCKFQANQNENFPTRRIGHVLDVLSVCELARKDYRMAKFYLLMHLQILDNKRTVDVSFSKCLLLLGHTSFRLKQFDEAELYTVRAWSMLLCIFGDDHSKITSCLRTMALIKEAQECNEEALILYETAYSGYLKEYGACHEETVGMMTCIERLKHKMRIQTDRSERSKGKELQQKQLPAAPCQFRSKIPRRTPNSSLRSLPSGDTEARSKVEWRKGAASPTPQQFSSKIRPPLHRQHHEARHRKTQEHGVELDIQKEQHLQHPASSQSSNKPPHRYCTTSLANFARREHRSTE